jgi:hypothetical protein
MANSRDVEAGPIVQAILKGDLKSLAPLLTPENINASIDPNNNTALIIAAANNQAHVVEYLMGQAAIDLKLWNQGTRAVAAACDAYDKKSPKKMQAIMRILTNKVFYHSTSLNIIPIDNPVLEKYVGKINNTKFTELFEALVYFQALGYQAGRVDIRFYLQRLDVIHAISVLFAHLNCFAASKQWFNLKARELNDLLIRNTDYLETVSENDLVMLIPVIKLLITIYKEQYADILENNSFGIHSATAYLCAYKLGILSLTKKNSSGDKKFFHDAIEIVENQHERQDEYIFTPEEGDMSFLRAYTRTHSKKFRDENISEEKRLSKQLDYLILLQPALKLGSPAAQIQINSQKELMPKLLSSIITDELHSDYNLEITGLKYFYGIEAKTDYQEAAKCFESAALTYETNSVNKAFNAYLLSIMVQYQAMITAHLPNSNKSAARRALKNFRYMLQFYVAYFSLPYHVEVFELLFGFIKNVKDKTHKSAFVNLLRKYIIKLAGEPVEFKEDLVNHIFKKLFESKLLDDNAIFNKMIDTLKECIKVNGIANLFYKKFDLLNNYPVADYQTRAKREYALMRARVDSCMEAVDFKHKTNEFNISILSKALQNVKLLPALALAAQEEFNMKRYSRVYLLWGEINPEEPEKYDGFKQAIELKNEYALHALLRLPPRREYQVTILHGLQNAIHREDSHSIEAVYNYVSTFNQYNNPLKKMAALAFKAIAKSNDDSNMIIAASKNYIPALIKLAAKTSLQLRRR